MSEEVDGGFCARSYFERDSDVVAEELIGSFIVVHDPLGVVRAMIVETEAYGGIEDPASHAFRGPTPRAAIMFGPAGFLYVYRSYGVHWCANVVTGSDGRGSAVLLRAAMIVADARPTESGDVTAPILRGPGNLTRGLGISGDDNKCDCCDEVSSRISFRIRDPGAVVPVGRSVRIGIPRAQERRSRYFFAGHPAVSGPRRLSPPLG